MHLTICRPPSQTSGADYAIVHKRHYTLPQQTRTTWTTPPDALLVTLDVSSLYTNIPHNEGITVCRHFLDTRDRNSSTVGTETLCDLIRMILTMKRELYLQRQTLLTDTQYSHGNQNGTLCQPVPCQI